VSDQSAKHGSLLVALDEGSNNQIFGDPVGTGALVRFELRDGPCHDNRIEIARGVILNDVTILVRGSHCLFRVETDVRFSGRITLSGRNSRCVIGKDTTVERLAVVAAEGAAVTIGSRCMISYQVEIRTSDAHSIIDTTSGLRINAPADVTIGDHVWLGAHTLIGKGVSIPNDVIVGQGSIVTKSVPQSNCVIAGNPARVIRTGTTWDVDLLPLPRG